MQSAGAVHIVILLATAVSATRNVPLHSKHHPVIKKADVVPKVLLGGKGMTNLGCGVGQPTEDCGKEIKMVLEVNKVLKKAEDVEKKAEAAEIESKKLKESVSEVEAAKKQEESEVAEETAVDEEVETAKEEVVNEDKEERQAKQTLEAEEQTLKKIPNPQAAAIVMQDEEKLKAKVEKKEIGKKVKEETVKTVEKESLVAKMKVVTSKTKVKAKVDLFKSELKAVTRMEKQVDKQEIYEVKLAVYNTGVKAASKKQAVADPAKATTAELVKQAELEKVDEASKEVEQAEVEAQEAEQEKQEAVVKMIEVKKEAETATEVQEITKKFGSVKKLEEEVKRCQPCAVPPPPLPKICAGKEGETCKCNGTVYFGKKFTSGKPGNGAITTLDAMKATPFKEKVVNGEIGCHNGAFGDPVPGFYKHCICVPSA